MKLYSLLYLSIGVIFYPVAQSDAAPIASDYIDLVPAGQTFSPTPASTFYGRGIYLRADEDLQVFSVAWNGNVSSGDYRITVTNGMGVSSTTQGSVVGTFDATLTNAGFDRYVIPTSFTLISGNEYHINLTRVDGTQNFAPEYEYLDWDYTDHPSGSDIGSITILDGTSTESDGAVIPYNYWLTHFELNAVVPEPQTYAAIFGIAVLGLALLRRRRN